MSMSEDQDLKQMTWKECQEYIQNNTLNDEGVKALIRLPKEQELYRAQRRKNLQIYVDYSDYIKQKYLQFETKKVLCDDNKWKLKAIERDESYKHCALFPNTFPYHFEVDIGHFVLWSTKRMSKGEVDEFIGESYPNQPFLWWENPMKKRSVPDVYHYQVLIKMCKENLILHGYIRHVLKKSSFNIPTSLLNQMMIYILACYVF